MEAIEKAWVGWQKMMQRNQGKRRELREREGKVFHIFHFMFQSIASTLFVDLHPTVIFLELLTN